MFVLSVSVRAWFGAHVVCPGRGIVSLRPLACVRSSIWRLFLSIWLGRVSTGGVGYLFGCLWWLRGVISLTIFGSLGSATVHFLVLVRCCAWGKLSTVPRLANVSGYYGSVSFFRSSCAGVLSGFVYFLFSWASLLPSGLAVTFDPLERKVTFSCLWSFVRVSLCAFYIIGLDLQWNGFYERGILKRRIFGCFPSWRVFGIDIQRYIVSSYVWFLCFIFCTSFFRGYERQLLGSIYPLSTSACRVLPIWLYSCYLHGDWEFY